MIQIDSRKVKKNDTFIAIRGIEDDGHNYIEEAIKKGAIKIIAETGNYEVETLIVKDTQKYLIEYLKKYDLSNLKIIGVTGTNGKTTTCYLIYQTLNLLGKKTAYIGTNGFFIETQIKTLGNTTPNIFEIYEMLLKCIEEKVEYVIMEISSHALELGRVQTIEFEHSIITNVTNEHLDFHKTINKYINSKNKLFLKTKGYKILNGDDKNFKKFATANILYGFNDYNDLKILDYKLNKKTYIKFKYDKKTYETTTNLIGKYNIYNYVSGVLLIHKLGYSIEEILKKSAQLKLPEGRMEVIKYKTNNIIIDYAHTPDAILKVYENKNLYDFKNSYTIIGCGGQRDRNNRKLIGKIVTESNDKVIFTNDNPRNENEINIINDILKGVSTSNYEINLDRKKAIKKGIELLNEKDILFILGKGHEKVQIINNKRIDFSDKKEVFKNIRKEK